MSLCDIPVTKCLSSFSVAITEYLRLGNLQRKVVHCSLWVLRLGSQWVAAQLLVRLSDYINSQSKLEGRIANQLLRESIILLTQTLSPGLIPQHCCTGDQA